MRKSLIQFACNIFPQRMTEIAYNRLAVPRTRPVREEEKEILSQARREVIQFKGFQIQTYEWGNGNDKILLVHGWEGNSGNFAYLIKRLVEADYTVYAFDAPAHGESSKGETNVFEFSELVSQMIGKYDVHKLVSHSFGSVATTYGLSVNPQLEIDKYVLFTTPDRFEERINFISSKVGITDKVKYKLIDKIQDEFQLEVKRLNVSDFVQSANVKQALIMHDKNDRLIPHTQAQNVNARWSKSELISIEGTGHMKILRSDFVIERVLKFLH